MAHHSSRSQTPLAKSTDHKKIAFALVTANTLISQKQTQHQTPPPHPQSPSTQNDPNAPPSSPSPPASSPTHPKSLPPLRAHHPHLLPHPPTTAQRAPHRTHRPALPHDPLIAQDPVTLDGLFSLKSVAIELVAEGAGDTRARATADGAGARGAGLGRVGPADLMVC